jgi:hypothetical protein
VAALNMLFYQHCLIALTMNRITTVAEFNSQRSDACAERMVLPSFCLVSTLQRSVANLLADGI